MLEEIRRQSIRLRDASDRHEIVVARVKQDLLERAALFPPDNSTFLAGAAFTTVALLVMRFARTAVARG
jgi:hypothetical protein